MQIEEYTFNIETYQNDWGVPIIFEAKTSKGFAIGDEIIIVFGTDKIATRSETVNSDNFTFEFKLTEAEANAVYDGSITNRISFPYSIKRYHDGQYLDTIINASIAFRSTVKWQN